MYSAKDRMWKLIDYNHAMSVEESLVTKRAAGTTGYVAPEACNDGFFTPQSDIWSLGKVFAAFFYTATAFMDENYAVFEDASNELNWLMGSMLREYPAERATLPEIVRIAYETLCIVAPAHEAHPNDKIIIAV